jgi:hypothetical protein
MFDIISSIKAAQKYSRYSPSGYPGSRQPALRTTLRNPLPQDIAPLGSPRNAQIQILHPILLKHQIVPRQDLILQGRQVRDKQRTVQNVPLSPRRRDARVDAKRAAVRERVLSNLGPLGLGAVLGLIGYQVGRALLGLGRYEVGRDVAVGGVGEEAHLLCVIAGGGGEVFVFVAGWGFR